MIYWILFVLISSILEALAFHNKLFVKHIHIYLTILRGCFCVPLAYYSNNLPMFILFCGFSFPFLHDGIYYTTRNLLNSQVYPKRWIDKSTTTNALISLSFFWRLIFFIFSIGFLPLIFL